MCEDGRLCKPPLKGEGNRRTAVEGFSGMNVVKKAKPLSQLR